MVDEAKSRAQITYDAAADHFDGPALAFWDRYGRATVERLDLVSGASVLDVCSGAGGSAVPAAERVAPTGRVLAVDLAENLLDLARAKADRAGLGEVLQTRCADLEELDEEAGSFDAVVIVFGLFFLPDVEKATAALWRLVAPRGQLAVTTWGPRLFEPANSVFWDAVSTVRPDLNRAYNPWESLTDPAALRQVLGRAGVPAADIEAVDGFQPLQSPGDFWAIVLGSGYRATHDLLTPQQQTLVHDRVVTELTSARIDRIETNVIYATATKP
jgi:ubiquinone/menaquinone biosynthesis C-methylase UbiE